LLGKTVTNYDSPVEACKFFGIGEL
jgi:hypothetical protein